MYLLISILSIWIFIRTASYGIYEIKQENNKIGGAIVLLLSLVCLIFPIVMIFLRGIS